MGDNSSPSPGDSPEAPDYQGNPAVDDTDLNSLVSPCKKLKLGPPQFCSTFAHTPTAKPTTSGPVRHSSVPLCCSTPIPGHDLKKSDGKRHSGEGSDDTIVDSETTVNSNGHDVDPCGTAVSEDKTVNVKAESSEQLESSTTNIATGAVNKHHETERLCKGNSDAKTGLSHDVKDEIDSRKETEDLDDTLTLNDELKREGFVELKDSGICFQDSVKDTEISAIKSVSFMSINKCKGLSIRDPNIIREVDKPQDRNVVIDTYMLKENIIINEDHLPNPKTKRGKRKKESGGKFIEYSGPGFTTSVKPGLQEKQETKIDTQEGDLKTCVLQEYGGAGLTSAPKGTVHAPTLKNNSEKDSANMLCSKVPKGQGIFLDNVPVKESAKATVFEILKNFNMATNTSSQSESDQQTSGSTLQQFSTGSGSALKPDEVYPSLSSSKGDSNSTEKINHKCLQSQGQLKISAYMNFGLLTVHVVQGRQLSTKWKSLCDSFVKMTIIPDDGKKPKCKTDIATDTNNPLYDEKFSFELNDEDHNKRLMISVWHRDQNAGVNEFLGCMSFGIRHLTNPKKEVSGWYYLLTEDIGRKKHLQVSQRLKPQLRVRNNAQSNIPSVNKDVWGMESMQITMRRGKNGFGFSVVEACPVRVGRVDGASPAESSGLQPGDVIIRLNKQNVSRSTATSVAKLVKHSSNTLVLDIQRQKPVTFEHLENSPWKSAPAPGGCHGNSDDEEEKSMPQMFTIADTCDDMKENEISVDEGLMFPMNPEIAHMATSTPLPLLARGHRTVRTCEMRKQEAIHRLLSLELDFIDLMHAGMQCYSRPLRHCVLSHTQHTALFQNIEKLTTISEYHIKQMHDNAPGSFMSDDTDESATSDHHNFVNSIGMIYQSKVHMLCQAYDLYAKGLQQANQVLSDLQRSADFVRFLQDSPQEGRQPSISQFIHRPVQHIRELYRVLQEIFLNTSQDSEDHHSLKQVVEGLQECANNITNYNCERVESVSSLTSRDSKTTSFTGSSMKSVSSSSCSGSSSRSKQTGGSSSCSVHTSRSVDVEVMKIQDRLIFPPNVPVFQLCQDDRHVIFSSDIYKVDGDQWTKLHMILFSDILLLTRKETDGYLRVMQEPLLVRDVAGVDAARKHGAEFVLHCSSRTRSSRKVNLRAPSTEQKYVWKTLIEQRIFAIRGSVEYFSSTSDVSSSSASAIII